MGVVRTIVFPALRLIVWALIAAALLYIAFGRTGADDADPAASPSVVIDPPATPVTRGDVTNTVSLQGTIEADPAATVKATATGEVGRVRASVGDAVEEGTPLFTVLVTVEPPVQTDPLAPPAQPTTKTVTVTAKAVGTLTSLDVLPEQSVTVGQEVAKVSPGTLTVSASMTQAQQYRLLEAPSTAQITVPGGPGTFECTNVRTGTPAAGQETTDPNQGYVDPYADPSSSLTGAQISCAVPPGVQVFSGLSATMDVTAGSATGVLLAPVTAVRGTIGTGTVWAVADDGTQTETEVQLGLTDGTNVEITGGLEENQQILQFVPNSDDMTDPYGMYGMGY
jgi:multidrug efflux pump subunit AcrA (membrane-fusion protein)